MLFLVVVTVVHGERSKRVSVAISVLNDLIVSSDHVRFGISNFSSSTCRFEPSEFELFGARQVRFVNLPMSQRTNVLLEPGESAVINLNRPLDGQPWRVEFSLTPTLPHQAGPKWGILSRLFRRREALLGVKAFSPVVRNGLAVSNITELTRDTMHVNGYLIE